MGQSPARGLGLARAPGKSQTGEIHSGGPAAVGLSSYLMRMPIMHAFRPVANRDGHIGRGDLAERTNR